MLAERHHSGTPATYHPTYDGNGNVSEYLDSSGQVTAHFEYDPFGNTVVASGSIGLFDYRFSTKPRDSETGLFYYGYRYYDPHTGRWPSRDPVEESGGVNLYGFVGNNGVGKWDILGLCGYFISPEHGLNPPEPPSSGFAIDGDLDCDGEGEEETEVLTADSISNSSPVGILCHKIDKFFNGSQDALDSAITATWNDPCGEDELLSMAVVNAPDENASGRLDGENGEMTIQSRHALRSEDTLKNASKAKFCCKCEE
jgi:RHS repeat-associated protein